VRSFDYIRPTTVAEAAGLLADNAGDPLVVAGGTAAVVLMHMGVLRPSLVIDVAGIGSMKRASGGSLGALTTIRALERSPHGLLAEAAEQVANVRVRNVATVGGAICYGEPQTDTPAALIALGATVEIASRSGTRSMALENFFLSPYETALERGELLTAVALPDPMSGSGGCHAKFTIGSPENKPVANASVQVSTDDGGRCTQARIVAGAVGPVPLLAAGAAERLIGEAPNDTLIGEVAADVAEQIDPVDDMRGPAWYKRRITRVLVERALRCALQRANDNRTPD